MTSSPLAGPPDGGSYLATKAALTRCGCEDIDGMTDLLRAVRSELPYT